VRTRRGGSFRTIDVDDIVGASGKDRLG